MTTHDIPLLAEVRQFAAIQKRLGGEPVFLWNCLGASSEEREFTVYFLALWVYLGYYPITTSTYTPNAFQARAIERAKALYEPISLHIHDKVEKVSRNKYYEPIQHRLATAVLSNGAYAIPMSDNGKREAREARKKEGKGIYMGPRMVQPRPRGLRGVYGDRRHQNCYTF